MSSRRFDRGNSSDHRSPSSLPDQRQSVPPVGREPDILRSQNPPVPPSTRQPHYLSPVVNPDSFVPQTPARSDQENWASMAASVEPGIATPAFQNQGGILAGNVGPYIETSSQNLQISSGLISGSFSHREMPSPSPNVGQENPDDAAYSSVMRGYESGASAPVANSQYPYIVGPPTSRQPGETDSPAQTVRLQEQQTYSPQHHSLDSPHPQIHIPPTGFPQQPSPGLHPPSGQPGYLQQGYELRPEVQNYQVPTATTIHSAQHPAYLSPFPETYVPQQIPQYHFPPGYPTMPELQPHTLSPLQPLAGTVPSRHSPSPVPMDQVRVVNSRPKPQCWEHGCNGREFSTFSNLLRHQREKAGLSAKPECPYCGTVFTRTTARNGHLSQGKCKARRQPTPK